MLKMHARIMELSNEFMMNNKLASTPILPKYKVGDPVLLQRRQGKAPKTSTMLVGPHRVVNVNGKIVTLKDLITDKTFPAHLEHLRPYHVRSVDDLTDESLESIAAVTSKSHYVVDTILEKRIKSSSLTKPAASLQAQDYEYLVSWQGYDMDSTTWQSHHFVKDTEAFKLHMQP